MKTCAKCEQAKSFTMFYKNKAREDGVSVYCIVCTKTYDQKNKSLRLKTKRDGYIRNPSVYKDRSFKNYRSSIEQRMLYSAKRRAKLKGIPFELTLEDLIIPETCPVLGYKLKINNESSKFDSPSLDKIVPEKGYVKGNVIIVSMKANQIKTNATLRELEAVFEFYRNKLL